MPRRQRELTDEGIYHVFNRGNDRRLLFREEQDFRQFMKALLAAKTRLHSDIYHYCLMTNHFHFLLQVRKGKDLPDLMREVQLTYTRYFNKKYRCVGHLFQERFRSPRIPEESYYLACGRYIERNPVKAGMVVEAASYPYSSAAYYVNAAIDPLLTANFYYEEMGRSDHERRLSYRKFLMIDEPYGDILDRELTKV